MIVTKNAWRHEKETTEHIKAQGQNTPKFASMNSRNPSQSVLPRTEDKENPT
jgi:hypothetical protein